MGNAQINETIVCYLFSIKVMHIFPLSFRIESNIGRSTHTHKQFICRNDDNISKRENPITNTL